MKKIILFGALLGGARSSPAQDVTTWLEQLAALNTLQHTVEQGYQSVTTGLQTIGDIKNDEYQLHEAYYGSQATVSPVVINDPDATALRNRLNELIQRLQTELAWWRKQQSITQP